MGTNCEAGEKLATCVPILSHARIIGLYRLSTLLPIDRLRVVRKIEPLVDFSRAAQLS